MIKNTFLQMSLLIFFCLVFFASCGDDEDGGNDVLPLVSIGDVTFFEGDDTRNFEFKVTLNTPTTKTASVDYSTKAISASATNDFVAVQNQTLTFEAGDFQKTIEIQIVTDDLLEADEQFEVELSNPVNLVIDDEIGLGTIKNDDEKLAISEEGYSTPETYDGWNLVWQDEFNDGALNTNDWTYELGDGCPNLCGWGNNESQFYTDSPENIFFQDGKLVIQAKQQNMGGKNYTSTRIKTQGKQFFQYGRVDIRAILPKGQGIWPALWMLGETIDDEGWPACGEIDIMELIGHQPNRVYGTAHYGADFNNHQFKGSSTSLSGATFSDEFHVFSIIWEENKIEWYMDDVLYYTLTNEDIIPNNFHFNDHPFFFIFNVAVGGNWPGYPDESTAFPQNMVVDYIRVFQEN